MAEKLVHKGALFAPPPPPPLLKVQWADDTEDFETADVRGISRFVIDWLFEMTIKEAASWLTLTMREEGVQSLDSLLVREKSLFEAMSESIGVKDVSRRSKCIEMFYHKTPSEDIENPFVKDPFKNE